MVPDLARAREAAEGFRVRHVAGKLHDKLPLDVVFIADNILRLDFVSFVGLQDSINSAAAITPGLTELYVDEALYSAYDSPYAPTWKKDRLRFSIAHEIGHIEMHAAIVPTIRCQTIPDLKRLFNAADGLRESIETEANEFAGRLIAPKDNLEQALRVFGAAQTDPRWRDSAELRDRFCDAYGARVGLHPKGVETRLNREELWPVEWTIGG